MSVNPRPFMECKDEEKVRNIRSFPHEIGLQKSKASNEKKVKVIKLKVCWAINMGQYKTLESSNRTRNKCKLAKRQKI